MTYHSSYHGTTKGGFTVFDSQFSDDNLSLFFSDSPNMSASYGYTINTFKRLNISNDQYVGDKTAKKFTDVSEAISFLKSLGYEVRTEEYSSYGRTYSKHKIHNPLNDTWYDEMSNTELKDYASSVRKTGLYSGGLYEVYVNAENPLIIDAGGRPWNKLSYNDMAAEYWNDDDDSFERTHPVEWQGRTTREIAKWAKGQGCDGVMIKNVWDYGKNVGGAKPGTIVIAFDSEQIKSVNKLNPTKSRDIRYSGRYRTDNYYRDVIPVSRKDAQNLNMPDDRNIARYRSEIDGVFDGSLPLGKDASALQRLLLPFPSYTAAVSHPPISGGYSFPAQ